MPFHTQKLKEIYFRSRSHRAALTGIAQHLSMHKQQPDRDGFMIVHQS
jgi:hypothetical protein